MSSTLWLPPHFKPAALDSLLGDTKRQAQQKPPESAEDADEERILMACPGLLRRYQHSYVPWYQSKIGAVPSDGFGFALDTDGAFDAGCVQRLTASLCGFLTYLLAASLSSDDVDEDFTAEDLELYATAIIRLTELRIKQDYDAEKVPAILARVIETKPGVRSELRARQRLLIEEHELPTDVSTASLLSLAA
jgi:hypothetical protein